MDQELQARDVMMRELKEQPALAQQCMKKFYDAQISEKSLMLGILFNHAYNPIGKCL